MTAGEQQAAPAGHRPSDDNPSLLWLLWLASPALPVGGFSYSEGLEAAVEWAGVRDAKATADWLEDQLHLSLARADLPLLGATMQAWRDDDQTRLLELNTWYLITRESRESRLQTEQMGRSMGVWLSRSALPAHHAPAARLQIERCLALPACYPVAYALALSLAGAGVRDGLLAYGFAWAENMVQAALKAIPLGQTDGQAVLARLATQLPTAVAEAMQRPQDTWQSFAPGLAILAARHETQYSRLFRS